MRSAMTTPQKDSFWTRAYRGGWIHGCYNRAEKREEIRVQFAKWHTQSGEKLPRRATGTERCEQKRGTLNN